MWIKFEHHFKKHWCLHTQPSTSILEYEIDPAKLGLEKARPVGKVHTQGNS
jgi:hypothetical protein